MALPSRCRLQGGLKAERKSGLIERAVRSIFSVPASAGDVRQLPRVVEVGLGRAVEPEVGEPAPVPDRRATLPRWAASRDRPRI